MITDQIVRALLSSRIGESLSAAATRLLYAEGLRRRLMRFASDKIQAELQSAPRLAQSDRGIGREHRLIALVVLHTVDRLIERHHPAPEDEAAR